MPNLQTARLSLVPLTRVMIERRLAENEFDLWIAHIGVVEFPNSWPGDALAMFPTFLERGTDPVEHTWVAVDRQSRTVVGQVGATSELSDGAIEIGYGFGVRGHGYATEAVGAVVSDLLARPSVRLVRANTAVENVASQRVLEKNGFLRTGTDHSAEDGDLITWERR